MLIFYKYTCHTNHIIIIYCISNVLSKYYVLIPAFLIISKNLFLISIDFFFYRAAMRPQITAVLQEEGVVPLQFQVHVDPLAAVRRKNHTSASTNCSKLLAKEISPKSN